MITALAVPSETTSGPWARAFAAGCGGQVSEANELPPGDVALFGSAARWKVLQEAIRDGRQWFYGDHAYFGRFQYYRATRGAYQHDASGEGDPARFDALGLQVLPWRTDGGPILLCPNSRPFMAMHGVRADDWITATTQALRRHTDRPIRVRWKDSPGRLDEAVAGAWAVVVWTSVCGVHAALAGIPCFSTAPCASRSFGTDDLALIERPARPANRYEMACALAVNQWTLAEMSEGMAWRHLNEEFPALALRL